MLCAIRVTLCVSGIVRAVHQSSSKLGDIPLVRLDLFESLPSRRVGCRASTTNSAAKSRSTSLYNGGASSRGGCRALQLYSALHLYSSTALYTLHPLHPPSGPGGPRALPGPACHSRAEAPKSAGRGAWRARRGENRPGEPSCPGPSAAHRPARSLTAGPGQEGLPGPFCARRAGEEKTGLAKARSAARERPLLTRPGPAGAPAGPGTGPARARPTYVRGPSYIRRLPSSYVKGLL